MTYPSAEERARIIARRKELRTELIAILAVGDLRRSKKKLDQLARQYDQAEVERVLDGLQKIFERDPDGDITWLYRDYAAYYRRFGGQRPWLSLAEFATAQEEFGALYARKELGPPLAPAEAQRLAELADWLFKEAELWEDLVPEDPPAVLPDLELPPVPAKPAQLDRQSLDWFLAGLLGFINPQYYKATATLELVPAWLRFLESHRLITAEQCRQALADLRGLDTEFLKVVQDHSDPALRLAMVGWRSDEDGDE